MRNRRASQSPSVDALTSDTFERPSWKVPPPLATMGDPE